MKRKILGSVLICSLILTNSVWTLAQSIDGPAEIEETFEPKKSDMEVFGDNTIETKEPETIVFQSGESDINDTFSDGEENNVDSETVELDGVFYRYDKESDSYAVLKGTGQKTLIFPDEVNGKPVNKVAEKAFYHDENLQYVSGLPAEIGESAFQGCVQLKEVDLNKTSRIEKNAFYGCENLIMVTLAEDTYLRSGAFQNCPKLTRIGAVDFIDGDADAFDPDNKIIIWNESGDIFLSRFNIIYVSVGVDVDREEDTYTKIGNLEYSNGVLANCEEEARGVIKVAASTSRTGIVKKVGRKSCYKCNEIETVILPQSIEEIETKAFYGCAGLKKIQIPASVTTIAEDAFDNTSGVVFHAPEGSYAQKYASAHGISCVTNAKDELGAAAVPKLTIKGNIVTAVLPVETPGADGYEIIIGPLDCDKTGNYWQKKNMDKTRRVVFEFVNKGRFSSYARAYKVVKGKKQYSEWSDWDHDYDEFVNATTPSAPKIVKLSVKGSTITAYLAASKDAEGYDVVLGKGRTSDKPVKYTYIRKNQKGTKIIFKNVKKGTYYIGTHSYNRSRDDKKKVFSKWSNLRKVTVK